MFENETVFILGAGASCDYGYPTGEQLVNDIISIGHRFYLYCDQRIKKNYLQHSTPTYIHKKVELGSGTVGIHKAWIETRNECEKLITTLMAVRPLVIDYFLTWNADLRDIGRFLIAAALIDYESRDTKERINPTIENVTKWLKIEKRKDWIRFLVHKLAYGCQTSSDLLRNRVHFITFNYDTSLELNLFLALSSINLFEKEHIQEFLDNQRIQHMYGKINDAPYQSAHNRVSLAMAASQLGKDIDIHSFDPMVNTQIKSRDEFLDHAYEASKPIRTVEFHDKPEDAKVIHIAQQWYRDSEHLYVFGYGFDDNNNRRIGLSEVPTVLKKVRYTNYAKTLTIGNRAATIFRTSLECTVSEKNVYDAIQEDFNALDFL